MLSKLSKHFRPNHFWNFRHCIEYKTKNKITKIKSFKLNKNKELKPVEMEITNVPEQIRKKIGYWYDNKLKTG